MKSVQLKYTVRYCLLFTLMLYLILLRVDRVDFFIKEYHFNEVKRNKILASNGRIRKG